MWESKDGTFSQKRRCLNQNLEYEEKVAKKGEDVGGRRLFQAERTKEPGTY